MKAIDVIKFFITKVQEAKCRLCYWHT